MITHKIILPFLFLALALNFSCSKDEEPEVKDFETIGFDAELVLEKLPDGLKNSDDEYAQMAVDYVESATDWSSFTDQLTPPEDAIKVGKKSSHTYKWTWNYGGAYVLTLWWTYHDDSDNRYWDIDIQYGDGERYDYLQATEAKNGKFGEILYNYQWICATDEASTDCEDLFWSYNWTVDDNDNYTFTYLIESEEDEYSASLTYETVINNDGSGSVKYYLYDELFYNINWDSEGNGSWTYYYGTEQMSGTWTVE